MTQFRNHFIFPVFLVSVNHESPEPCCRRLQTVFWAVKSVRRKPGDQLYPSHYSDPRLISIYSDTHSWIQRKKCASEKVDVANFVLLLHKACVSLSSFSKKSKQNLACPIDCQNSQGYKKHQALLCSGDKGLQSNSSTIHTYRGLNDMRNTVKIPWKRNCSDSQSSVCFPLTFHPLVFSVTMENISCYHVCSPQCLHLFSLFLRLCHPNTDLPRDDTLRSEPAP